MLFQEKIFGIGIEKTCQYWAKSLELNPNIRFRMIDDVQGYNTVRELRWPEGRQCPFCDSKRVIKRGFDEKASARQRYECKDCGKRFDDLTGTIFAGHRKSPASLAD